MPTTLVEKTLICRFFFLVCVSGITIVPGKQPVIVGKKGKRQISRLKAAERSSLITVICCMSASGIFVPPMIIFPRKNESKLLEKGKPEGSLIRYHPSGWVQSCLFTEWFNHFIQFTRPTEEAPVLLILDGHCTHTRNLEVIDLARAHHVTIVSLPPHTTHRLQPLDRAYMSPFKHSYLEEIRLFTNHY